MEEPSQQADVAAHLGHKQELRLAQMIEDQSHECANGVDCGVDYGLAASVWTRDVGCALRMARKLQSGYGEGMGIYSLEQRKQIQHVGASHD